MGIQSGRSVPLVNLALVNKLQKIELYILYYLENKQKRHILIRLWSALLFAISNINRFCNDKTQCLIFPQDIEPFVKKLTVSKYRFVITAELNVKLPKNQLLHKQESQKQFTIETLILGCPMILL